MLYLRDFISRCARTWPDSEAFISGENRRTWRDIDHRSDRLANALQELGIGKGDVVATLGHEHIEKPEILFACLKIGAVRTGINWRYSPDQMLHIVRDSDARALFIQSNCVETLVEHLDDFRAEDRELIEFGEEGSLNQTYESLLETAPPEPELPPLSDDDVASIIYTSGTTGRPKGAMLTQGNLRESLIQGVIATGLDHEDVWLNVTPHAGVTSVYTLMGLMNGMTTVLPAGDFDPHSFLELCERHRVTSSVLVVTALRRVVERQRSEEFDLSSFRLMAYGSETATPAALREAKRVLGCRLLQYYGMTEVAAPWVSVLWDEDHRRGLEEDEKLLSSCGKPNPFSELTILDETGNELPPGERGEICVAGDVVMEGYLNLPEVTEETFEGRWYRTGDVGYRDDAGYFYLVDRKDFLIMSGAMKVYPSSVEMVLDEHEGIADVAVVGVPHPDWGEAVVAVVQPRPDSSLTPDELLSFVRDELADFERPKHVHFMEQLPRGVTGKIDRIGLEERFRTDPDLVPWSLPDEE